MYLFSYYLGGSVAGVFGGILYDVGGWSATVCFVVVLLMTGAALVALLVRDNGFRTGRRVVAGVATAK